MGGKCTGDCPLCGKRTVAVSLRTSRNPQAGRLPDNEHCRRPSRDARRSALYRMHGSNGCWRHRPPGCDQIPTPAENQLCPYSEHTCAHRHAHGSRKLLVIEGVKSPQTRSCHEYHPPGLSKKVRAAVGRQICATGARTLVPKKRGSTARRARQSQKGKPEGLVGRRA